MQGPLLSLKARGSASGLADLSCLSVAEMGLLYMEHGPSQRHSHCPFRCGSPLRVLSLFLRQGEVACGLFSGDIVETCKGEKLGLAMCRGLWTELYQQQNYQGVLGHSWLPAAEPHMRSQHGIEWGTAPTSLPEQKGTSIRCQCDQYGLCNPSCLVTH